MITLLIVILAVALTYLITDYRRHMQIQAIEFAHAKEMNEEYMNGWETGYVDAERYYTRQISSLRKPLDS